MKIVSIIIKHFAELCNGSTTDSDSVCLGSNPSSATKTVVAEKPLLFFLSGYGADGSALGSGPRGREFESPYSDQKQKSDVKTKI